MLQVQSNGTAALQQTNARFANLEAAVASLAESVARQGQAHSASLQAGLERVAAVLEVRVLQYSKV